jgi:hypothetical protein
MKIEAVRRFMVVQVGFREFHGWRRKKHLLLGITGKSLYKDETIETPLFCSLILL